MVLFSCPLPLKSFDPASDIRVERVGRKTITKVDYERILGVWNPKSRARQFAYRFEAGSELWLAKMDGSLAAFGWTIKGRTVEPHFFPLQSGDLHLFDFFVFPDHRGRGVNVTLVMQVLAQLGQEDVRCAHIECAAWNDAQFRSLGKTAFRRYAEATKLRVLGHTIVIWH
jgi:GNAT superfamily N-acetyltransferase